MQNKEKQNLLKKPGFWLVLLLVILWAMVSNMMKGAQEIAKSSRQEGQSSPEPEITEEYKESLAQTFCEERSKEYSRSVDFDDFILMYENIGREVDLHPETGMPTEENCKKVVGICLAVWNKKDCERIAEKNIWVGMDKDQAILSWGLPNDTNNTVTGGGIRSQWVYGDFGPYVYLEGKTKADLVVTSWQD